VATVRRDAGAHRASLTITVSRGSGDLPDGNNASQRPDVVPSVSAIPSNQTPDQWLNIGAFAVPARGAWGNVARNTLRGPGLVQVDLALQKQLIINGARTFEFRWEAFNVFNRMNLANPGTNISSPAQFGRITGPLNNGYGTGTARQMQFMFRVNF
jgi:hypothetical protein